MGVQVGPEYARSPRSVVPNARDHVRREDAPDQLVGGKIQACCSAPDHNVGSGIACPSYDNPGGLNGDRQARRPRCQHAWPFG
jgi:hypothetical protein